MKKVTAIITTHNRYKYLKKAVNSVLRQTYKNIEIIVVDDASTDDTKNYGYELEKKGIKYIRIEKSDSKGGNYARNLGILNSTGEYIAFLDDDDEWLETKIEKQVKILDLDDNIGLVYCGLNRSYNSGVYSEIQLPSYRGDASKYIFYNFLCLSSTMMIRKELLIDVGYFDEELRYWQDYELTIRIAQATMVDYVNEPLVLYRVNLDDKKRLTNNTDGWLESVEYINEKFKHQIEMLTSDEKKFREILICNDHISRLTTTRNKKLRRAIFLKRYKITGKFKDLLKYILNFTKSDLQIIRLNYLRYIRSKTSVY